MDRVSAVHYSCGRSDDDWHWKVLVSVLDKLGSRHHSWQYLATCARSAITVCSTLARTLACKALHCHYRWIRNFLYVVLTELKSVGARTKPWGQSFACLCQELVWSPIWTEKQCFLNSNWTVFYTPMCVWSHFNSLDKIHACQMVAYTVLDPGRLGTFSAAFLNHFPCMLLVPNFITHMSTTSKPWPGHTLLGLFAGLRVQVDCSTHSAKRWTVGWQQNVGLSMLHRDYNFCLCPDHGD